MTLYNNSLYLPPISLPKIDYELSDNFSDDRVKIAEVEKAFEEFEHELVSQLYRQCSPVGKRAVNFSADLDDLVPVTNNTNISRTSASRGLTPPVYSNSLDQFGDSLNLGQEMDELHLSQATPVSTRLSGSGRLPRRIVAPPGLTNSASTSAVTNFNISATIQTPIGTTVSERTIPAPPSITGPETGTGSVTEATRSWSPVTGSDLAAAADVVSTETGGHNSSFIAYDDDDDIEDDEDEELNATEPGTDTTGADLTAATADSSSHSNEIDDNSSSVVN